MRELNEEQINWQDAIEIALDIDFFNYTVFKIAGKECPHCDAAVAMLTMLGREPKVVELSGEQVANFPFDTVPQIFYDYEHVGGRADLELHLNERGLLPLFQPLRDGLTPPTRGSDEAAGMDLYAAFDCACELDETKPGLAGVGDFEKVIRIPTGERRLIPTGWAIMVPKGTYGRIAPRSGLALKQGVMTMAGVVDRDYRGEVHVMVYNAGHEDLCIHHGDRVAQLVLEQIATPPAGVVVDALPDTSRGDGGYGSTGR